ncbi:SWIM zinc finger family protein [Candidatus Woesearchaeota archaeon]|nr:SWIM zinc finger family protein [Candidatus Woesearchaeota archaeon]
MRALKQKDGTFKVESRTPGRYYIVDPEKRSCTCPHYRFRLARSGGLCKHLRFLQDKLDKKEAKSCSGMIDYIKKKGDVDSLELIKKFGESALDSLLEKGELIEDKGKVKLLS